MLGKLLKYEIKAMGRVFVPIYLAILSVSLLQALFGNSPLEWYRVTTVQNIIAIVMIGLFVALGVITLVMIIQRFYKNLLKDEGYLMFTLPVSTRSLILSKLITTFIWCVASLVVASISFVILFSGVEGFWTGFNEALYMIWNEIIHELDGVKVLYVLEIIIMSISDWFSQVLVIYLALAVTQLPFVHKYRIPAAFIAFFIINVIFAQIGFMAMDVNYFTASTMSFERALHIGTIMNIISCIVLFEGTHYILNKYLNLE